MTRRRGVALAALLLALSAAGVVTALAYRPRWHVNGVNFGVEVDMSAEEVEAIIGRRGTTPC